MLNRPGPLLAVVLAALALDASPAVATGIDANTDLMLHLDGGFGDSSTYGRTTTLAGSPTIDAGTTKFGAGAARFNGNGQGVYYDVATLTYPYTVDLWVRFNSFTAYDNIFGRFDTILLHMNNNGGGTGTRFDVQQMNGGLGAGTFTSAVSAVVNTWYHLALVMTAKTAGTFYVNGNPETISFGAAFGSWGHLGTSTSFDFGTFDPANGYGVDGWLDEVRVSMGVARYSGAFTPPTAPYDTSTAPEPASAALLALCGAGAAASSLRRRAGRRP